MIVSAGNRFLVCSQAGLLEPGDRLQAWAERHVRQDPDIRWVLGNYVEANEPNSNGHIFPLDQLVVAQKTLAGKPLNMMHREHYIVGAFAGAQLLHADGGEFHDGDTEHLPSGVAAADGVSRPPYVEALAALWHNRFPEEYFNIRRAHAEGSLFFSMEAVPEEVSCPTCAHQAVYAGVSADSYCEHMQGALGPKILHKPVFNGGAIIIPPVRPGWSRADVTAISKLVVDAAEEAAAVYESVSAEASHLDPGEWEAIMAQVLRVAADAASGSPPGKGMAMAEGKMPMMSRQDVAMAVKAVPGASDPVGAKARVKKRAQELKCQDLIPSGWGPVAARDFSQGTRNKMAKQGSAMPDGSYPIANEQDLKNAIQAIGRAKNPAAVKQHIKKRARALGLTKLLPDGW